LPRRVDRRRPAGIWARHRCEFRTDKATRSPTRRVRIATTRTLFSTLAPILGTERFAVPPNNASACPL